MKLINAELKSEREMMEHLVLNGDLYDKETGVRFYFSEDRAKAGSVCFFVVRANGICAKIQESWGNFKDMEKEMTLKDAVRSGKRIPCWTNSDKTRVCLIDNFDIASGSLVSSDGSFISDPIPIEQDELF